MSDMIVDLHGASISCSPPSDPTMLYVVVALLAVTIAAAFAFVTLKYRRRSMRLHFETSDPETWGG